jgi:hypothetical protein
MDEEPAATAFTSFSADFLSPPAFDEGANLASPEMGESGVDLSAAGGAETDQGDVVGGVDEAASDPLQPYFDIAAHHQSAPGDDISTGASDPLGDIVQPGDDALVPTGDESGAGADQSPVSEYLSFAQGVDDHGLAPDATGQEPSANDYGHLVTSDGSPLEVPDLAPPDVLEGTFAGTAPDTLVPEPGETTTADTAVEPSPDAFAPDDNQQHAV